MTTGADVLKMLFPNGGYIITGDEYEGIEFINCEAITKQQFLDAFVIYENYKNDKEQKIKISRAALLNKLGITEDEARLLLS